MMNQVVGEQSSVGDTRIIEAKISEAPAISDADSHGARLVDAFWCGGRARCRRHAGARLPRRWLSLVGQRADRDRGGDVARVRDVEDGPP